MEEKIIIGLQSIGNTFLDVFFKGVSHVASWVGAILLFLIILIFVSRKFGFIFCGGFLVTIGINYILKILINRQRPFVANPQIINKLQTIGQSFPSGHMVSATFMVFAVLFLLYTLYKMGRLNIFGKRWFKILSITIGSAFIVLTGISRMYLGQHYLTDLIGGFVVGLMGFIVTVFVYNKITEKTARTNTD